MFEKEPENVDKDLLKNLEEDLKKFESRKQIQDFVPYKESVIWQLSDAYYRSKGIMAWSNNASKIIPHKIGTNYQSALAFAKLVKVNLEKFPSKEKVRVLEVGAGSGRFSRHFLLAIKELGIQDKVMLIISDYSQANLASIKVAKILDEFIEGKEYRFELIDITKKDGLLKLKPRAVFMHYVLDALPLTIIKKTDKVEELFISSSIREEQELDVLNNDFLQSRIEHEDSWHDYEPESELEKKYWGFFSEYHSRSFNRELYYSYTALEAMSNLLEALDEQGFLLNIDILPGNERRYIVVGNSIAHEVDNYLLESFVKVNSGEASVKDDRSISRLLVTIKEEVLNTMIPIFTQVFEKENLVRDYIDLENEIEKDLEDGVSSGVEAKLKKLIKLAPHYAYSYELFARYYVMISDDLKAIEYQKKAQAIDYWKDL